ARAQGRFTDGPALHLGGTAGNANDDARTGRKQPFRVHHPDELLEHLLRDGEVSNDAVFHRPDGFNVAWDAAEHLLGLFTDRLNRLLAAGPAFLANGHHRRLVQHDALAADVDQGIGGTEVD